MREETADPGTKSRPSIRSAARSREPRGPDERERRRLLCGGTPREILERLLDGDPLRLRTIVARRLRRDRLLLDADRVFLCALARCAREARRYTGRPSTTAWLGERVDDAVAEVLRRDLASLRGGQADEGSCTTEGAYAELAPPLGLDPREMLAACARFNALESADRDTFFALFVEGRSIDECAREAGLSASAVARRARLVIDTFLSARGGRR